MDNISLVFIEKVAIEVRAVMEERYGTGWQLAGHCIEASDLIVERLARFGVNAKAVEGWCVYEDDSSCSDRCYDEHTWVECQEIYIDVTADQFNSCMFNELKPIIIGERPECMKYDEPEYKWLDERDKIEETNFFQSVSSS